MQKKRILDLEDELAKVQQKAGDVILDTKDNVFTNKELKKIRFLELWSILGPIVGLLIGLIF